jgi:hypothetical protein
MKKGNHKGNKNGMYGVHRFGKDNPNHKHGYYCTKHYCKCGNKISTITFIYGKGKCRSCAAKGNSNGNFKDGNTLQITCQCGNEKDCRSQLCQDCYLKTNKGKNHGNWLGGISKLPYAFEFDNILKESIRQRDNYTCRKCGIQQKELNSYHKKLTIHHIDYNKCNCKNKNLISLCHGCNSQVNFNRDYWFAYFTYIMEIKINVKL